MQSNYNRIGNYDAEILAVSMDDFEGAGTMIANARAYYPVLYTTRDASVPEAYEVYNLHGDLVAAPAVFIIDKDGKIAYSYIGIDIGDRAPTDDIVEALRKIERG